MTPLRTPLESTIKQTRGWWRLGMPLSIHKILYSHSLFQQEERIHTHLQAMNNCDGKIVCSTITPHTPTQGNLNSVFHHNIEYSNTRELHMI